MDPTDHVSRCPACGYAFDSLLHILTCDGRQGHVEAQAVPPLPTLAEARAAGEAGMQQALDAAVRRTDFDPQAAAIAIVEHLRRCAPDPVRQEDLTQAVMESDNAPHSRRAFGAVFKGLRRRGLIVSVGTYPRRLGHGADGGHLYVLAH